MALKNKHLLVVSFGLAVQATILVLLNAFIPIVAGKEAMWIAFQAWAVYFLAGCTPMGGVKAWIGYASGIAASIAILELMGVPGVKDLPTPGGMSLTMAVAVFVMVFPIIMSENLKNMVPALFIGAGAFFGLFAILGGFTETGADRGLYGLAIRIELVYCAIGLIFGFISVFWRGKYEAYLERKGVK